MILYVNGDSNTFGDELVPLDMRRRLRPLKNEGFSDLVPVENDEEAALIAEYRTAHRWSSILAKHLMAEEVNEAINGGNNERAVRMTLEWINHNIAAISNNPKTYCVVLGLTAVMRFEVYQYDKWQTMGPNFGDNKVRTAYFNHLYSDKQAISRYWMQILQVQTLCQTLGMPHLIFNCYPEVNSGVHHSKPSAFQDLIDHSRIADEIMQNHCHGLPRGPRFHFFEEGHERWANYLKRYF